MEQFFVWRMCLILLFFLLRYLNAKPLFLKYICFVIESDPSANRPPYPLGDSYFPSPHRNYMIPPKPDVHLPASYIIRPSAPPSLPSAPSAPSPRRSPRNSPPPAETEALLLRNGKYC